jgi:hypothetical protein
MSNEEQTGERKGFIRAFLDFFILFSGISTASNLTRTQDRPVRRLGLFLFRPKFARRAGEVERKP